MSLKNPFKSFESSIRHGIEGLGNDVKRGINDLGGDVKRSINDAQHSAEGGINKVASDARHSFADVQHKAESEITKIAGDAAHAIKNTASQIEDELEDAAKQALEATKDEAIALAQAAMKEISRGAINKVVDAAQVVMPTSVGLSLGPIKLSIGDMTGRIDTLQRWASNPPSSKDDIRQIIIEVAPTSVSINLSFSLAFLFVQSDSLKLGVTATYNTKDFLDKMDEILGRFGINI